MSLRYLDICSGISAPTMAWKPLGWQALCFAEIEAAPRAVLAHHYPDVPLRGDFTEIKGTEYGPVDLLVGGTPCQSFSVAGLRGGLGDGRGNLALEYLRLADRARPRWLAWENVPGVLSSNGGRDFGAIVGGMVELGYGIAYRVLDAQYIGVPQRRRRVFVVGYLGDWRRAAAVLFERHSLQGHSPPSREAGERIAGSTEECAHGFRETGQGWWTEGPAGLRAEPGGMPETVIAPTLNATSGATGRDCETAGRLIVHSLRAEGFDASEDGTGRGTPLVPVSFTGDPCHPLASGAHPPAVAFDMRGREGGAQFEGPHSTANMRAASGGSSRSYVAASAVRRLTPKECERLQGFPDDFTFVARRSGQMMADGPRYKMLGNSMAVPVVRWIGERIAAVEAIACDSRHLPNGEDRSCGLRAEPKWRGDAKRQSPLTHCKGSLFDTEGMAA